MASPVTAHTTVKPTKTAHRGAQLLSTASQHSHTACAQRHSCNSCTGAQLHSSTVCSTAAHHSCTAQLRRHSCIASLAQLHSCTSQDTRRYRGSASQLHRSERAQPVPHGTTAHHSCRPAQLHSMHSYEEQRKPSTGAQLHSCTGARLSPAQRSCAA
jgi:hypothetical protein